MKEFLAYVYIGELVASTIAKNKRCRKLTRYRRSELSLGIATLKQFENLSKNTVFFRNFEGF